MLLWLHTVNLCLVARSHVYGRCVTLPFEFYLNSELNDIDVGDFDNNNDIYLNYQHSDVAALLLLIKMEFCRCNMPCIVIQSTRFENLGPSFRTKLTSVAPISWVLEFFRKLILCILVNSWSASVDSIIYKMLTRYSAVSLICLCGFYKFIESTDFWKIRPVMLLRLPPLSPCLRKG